MRLGNDFMRLQRLASTVSDPKRLFVRIRRFLDSPFFVHPLDVSFVYPSSENAECGQIFKCALLGEVVSELVTERISNAGEDAFSKRHRAALNA